MTETAQTLHSDHHNCVLRTDCHQHSKFPFSTINPPTRSCASVSGPSTFAVVSPFRGSACLAYAGLGGGLTSQGSGCKRPNTPAQPVAQRLAVFYRFLVSPPFDSLFTAAFCCRYQRILSSPTYKHLSLEGVPVAQLHKRSLSLQQVRCVCFVLTGLLFAPPACCCCWPVFRILFYSRPGEATVCCGPDNGHVQSGQVTPSHLVT